MQEVTVIMDLIMAFSMLTLYGTVTWGLLRYGRTKSDRYWALGWIVYSGGGFFGIMVSTNQLVITDIIPLLLMYLGSILIHEGSKNVSGPILRPLYVGGGVVLMAILGVGLVFDLHFVFIFTPMGLLVAYSCIESAGAVRSRDPVMKQQHLWLVGGLLLWAASWIVFPLALMPSGYEFVMAIQGVAVLLTGAAMLMFFIGSLTESLEMQYRISQVVSGVVQHDIRNYLQTVQNALELAKTSTERDHWFSIADSTLSHASRFIDEMRDIAAATSREEMTTSEVLIVHVVEQVWTRVKHEYSLDDDQITITIPPRRTLRTCGLITELMWNIIDNAFKHGSKSVRVSEEFENGVIRALIIEDDGGGLPDTVRDFLNSPSGLKEPVAPGLGLGLLLIRGLSQLCGVSLTTTDSIDDGGVRGTIFRLGFNGH
ncbi:MAG: sensor histidine kinase [Candidatus Thorarchaeota archaeon]|nr:MAG: hypothetical protein DRO87_08840 [Candidatus Thorarchaeota archaeon]RLI57477.1 MAG: hypothetical protein DRP09_02995 [Candidatus Thorarchaeota archaeon]